MRRHHLGALRFACIFLASLSWGSPVLAATFCVSNVAQLRQVLQTAGQNGLDDVIQIQRGVYRIDAPLRYVSEESRTLTLVGGYAGMPGSGGCLRLTRDPAATVIDGQGVSRLLQLDARPGALTTFTVKGLTLRNGYDDARLPIVEIGGTDATVELDGNVIEDLLGTDGSPAVSLRTERGALTVRNNVFTRIIGGGPTAPVSLAYLNGQGAGTFVNNTMTGNASLGEGVDRTGGLFLQGVGRWVLSNNILWGNDGYDFEHGYSDGDFTLRHNVIGRHRGSANAASFGNFSTDPRWVSATDLRLRGNSPLFDAGDADPPGGLGELDAWGGQRVVGNAPDIGAYERQEVIFANGW